MAEYQVLENAGPSVMSVNQLNVESFQLEKESVLMPFVKKFKKWCIIIIVLAVPYPVAAWFVDEQHILFYQSWFFFVAQISLGLLGLRCLVYNLYKRLECLTKLINIYFLIFLVALALNMSFFTYSVVRHNKDNCGDFDFYQVCDDRWGLMGEQLTLIIYYPLILFIVFLIYRYFLQTTKELMMNLLRREI
jgi:hypothetical protein